VWFRRIAPVREATSRRRGAPRVGASTPAGRFGERWPLLDSCSLAVQWLELQRDLGRSPGTDRGLRPVVGRLPEVLRAHGVDSAGAGRAKIPWHVRDLRERPRRRGGKVVALDSGAGLANATLQRMLVEIPLTDDERAAAEGDQAAVDRLVEALRHPHARRQHRSEPAGPETGGGA
jgi:hypothetical protein